MGITYSLYRPNSTSQDTSTLATITANEGVQDAAVGQMVTFTFDVPDGLWARATVELTIGTSGPNQAYLALADATGAGGTPAVAAGTSASSGGMATTVYFFGDGPVNQAVNSNPLANLSPSTVSGYARYAGLKSGSTATLQVTPQADPHSPNAPKVTGLSAVMTLQSITPALPFADFSGQAASGGPPFTGAATAALPLTYNVIGPKDGGATPNGLAPLSYLWQNVPYGPGATLETSGQSTPPDTLQDSWSFPALTEQAGGVGEVYVVVTLTNSPYPHQVDKPRSASFGGYFAYLVNQATVITPNAAYALNEDAHRRPVALTPNRAYPLNTRTGPSGQAATSINGLVSNDAGRTYLIDYISDVATSTGANFGADNPCLLVDRRSNHYRAIYSKVIGQQPSLLLATGLLDDRFSQVAGSPAVIPSLMGGLCAAAQHPTDADFALLVYSDIGTSASPGSHDLKCAQSLDAGATWKPLGTILPALDLTATGRPALCFLGSTAVLVYSSGVTLFCLTSMDRGQSWQKAGTVSVYTPGGSGFAYFCLSLAAHGGRVYLLVFAGNTQAKGLTQATSLAPPQTSPRLFVSGNAGQTWTLQAAEKPISTSAPAEYTTPPPGVLPAIQAPSGLGVGSFSGLLRLDTTFVSQDCGLIWLPSST